MYRQSETRDRANLRFMDSVIRWLVSRWIRYCADKLLVLIGGGWERDKVKRTAKRYDDVTVTAKMLG